MIPSLDALSLPQVYSTDYYFRAAVRELASLGLQHGLTTQDTAVLGDVHRLRLPGRRAGMTEWEGVCRGCPLSLGWDWAELEDGHIRPLTLVAPRTNIMLIDDRGYDMPDESSAALLWAFIATLAWQQPVARALAEDPSIAGGLAAL